ncbi:hypothetical protein EI626_01415 [Listeria monocytogenes]|nr:hypothetical protein [Listeria innocua]EAC4268441.1 hypothetical protein [Listeria innocua]EAC6253838.1 hypothetical protein [Listeria monocytogenes]EAD4135184.1 hypothetical protein [Listeria monocytogenes]
MIGKLSENGLNQQKFRRVSYRFYCQFSKILPKATKLSLFWCFLPENSTREFYQRFLARKLDLYRVKHIYFFKRKIIILKGLLKIAFLLEKGS